MNDFEEGFALGYVLSKKKYSGGKKYDPIFHDILDNSEAFCTIIIDDVYKFTLNLWAPMRRDIPCGRYRNWTPLNAVEAEGVGYSQTPVTYTKWLYVYRILWKNGKPMYAAYESSDRYDICSPSPVDIHQSLDHEMPFKYYTYYANTYEYVKGSAAASCDSELCIKPAFKEGMYGTKILELNNIKIVDSDGNTVRPGCTYKLKDKTYKTVYEETEWTNPSNGQTSTVKDYTKPPKIILNYAREKVSRISCSNNLDIYSFPSSVGGAIYSDLPENKLDSLTDELLKAICEKYGDKSCYTHIPAEWLVPEDKKTI